MLSAIQQPAVPLFCSGRLGHVHMVREAEAELWHHKRAISYFHFPFVEL
jgi:hypothetical protein